MTWITNTVKWPGAVWHRAAAAVKAGYQRLKTRHGPRYTRAMLIVALVAFFMPLPGAIPLSIALVVVVAEAHRAIILHGGMAEATGALLAFVTAHLPFCVTGRLASSVHRSRR